MVAEFRRRRDGFVATLNEVPGFRCALPGGAFYAFPNVTGTGLTARDLAETLLVDAGVAVLSGTAFGEYGEGYLRLSYATSLDLIEEALFAIGRTLGSLKPQPEGGGNAPDRSQALRPSHQ
jgi:aspartate/methionine/tyrosine aminotransferase